MRFYLKNILARFPPDTIRNDGAIGFLDHVKERGRPQLEQERLNP